MTRDARQWGITTGLNGFRRRGRLGTRAADDDDRPVDDTVCDLVEVIPEVPITPPHTYFITTSTPAFAKRKKTPMGDN